MRLSVERTLAASPVAMPATWRLRVDDAGLGLVDRRLPLDRSSWSRIWLNSTRLTMTTTVPATTIVIAPMRTCSDERQVCTPARRRGG